MLYTQPGTVDGFYFWTLVSFLLCGFTFVKNLFSLPLKLFIRCLCVSELIYLCDMLWR